MTFCGVVRATTLTKCAALPSLDQVRLVKNGGSRA
jgi:hypothetical protein